MCERWIALWDRSTDRGDVLGVGLDGLSAAETVPARGAVPGRQPCVSAFTSHRLPYRQVQGRLKG